MKTVGIVPRAMGGLLLAFGLTLGAKPPPQGEDWGSIQLTNSGSEPQALGVATLTQVMTTALSYYDSDEWRQGYRGTLTVECRNLTPGATYSTPAGTLKADRRGRGKVTGEVSFSVVWEISWWGSSTMIVGDLLTPYEVEVVRLDPSGSDVPVLSGSFVPPE